MATVALGHARTELSLNDRDDIEALRAAYGAFATPDAATERDLIAAAQSGDTEARQAVVLGHWRVVANIAKKYAGNGVFLADLVQEGLMELTTRVDKFDLSRANRLTTYALPWIDQRISRHVNAHGNTIRSPQTMVERLAKFDRRVEGFTKTHGRAPNNNELAALGINPDYYRKLRQAKRESTSLELMDFGEPYTESTTDESDARLDVAALLDQLDTSQRRLIKLRIYENLTIVEIAERLNSNEQAIRRQMTDAMRQLRQVAYGGSVWTNVARFQSVLDKLPSEPEHEDDLDV